MKDKKELLRTIKFTLFSISAGIIETIVFTLLTEFTSFDYWLCYLPALVLSVVWNFTLNREYTFKSCVNIPKAMAQVFLFYLVFTPASTLLGNYLAENLHLNDYLVTIINMILNFVLEYLYWKYVVFKGHIDEKDKNKSVSEETH